MSLYRSASQYREKSTIWGVMSVLPLFGTLAEGHIWRWFAANIPMDLGTGPGYFKSDIDLIAKLRSKPPARDSIYATWEIKVGLIDIDGSGRSLKAGKTKRTLTQLRAYREFGAPRVSLLEAYVCESGCLVANGFPVPSIEQLLRRRADALRPYGFGYQTLAIEQIPGRELHDAFLGLQGDGVMPNATLDLLRPSVGQACEPFTRLAARLDDFFESCSDERKSFRQIIFCRKCRRLALIKMKATRNCPHCTGDLLEQS